MAIIIRDNCLFDFVLKPNYQFDSIFLVCLFAAFKMNTRRPVSTKPLRVHFKKRKIKSHFIMTKIPPTLSSSNPFSGPLSLSYPFLSLRGAVAGERGGAGGGEGPPAAVAGHGGRGSTPAPTCGGGGLRVDRRPVMEGHRRGPGGRIRRCQLAGGALTRIHVPLVEEPAGGPWRRGSGPQRGEGRPARRGSSTQKSMPSGRGLVASPNEPHA